MCDYARRVRRVPPHFCWEAEAIGAGPNPHLRARIFRANPDSAPRWPAYLELSPPSPSMSWPGHRT